MFILLCIKIIDIKKKLFTCGRKPADLNLEYFILLSFVEQLEDNSALAYP